MFKDGGIWVKDGNDTFQEGGILSDTRLIKYIYYNATISYIYHLKYLKYINNATNAYDDGDILSFLNSFIPQKSLQKIIFPL